MKENTKMKSKKTQMNETGNWDLLRQRRALKDAGKNLDDAKLRPPGIVENYEL